MLFARVSRRRSRNLRAGEKNGARGEVIPTLLAGSQIAANRRCFEQFPIVEPQNEYFLRLFILETRRKITETKNKFIKKSYKSQFTDRLP